MLTKEIKDMADKELQGLNESELRELLIKKQEELMETVQKIESVTTFKAHGYVATSIDTNTFLVPSISTYGDDHVLAAVIATSEKGTYLGGNLKLYLNNPSLLKGVDE